MPARRPAMDGAAVERIALIARPLGRIALIARPLGRIGISAPPLRHWLNHAYVIVPQHQHPFCHPEPQRSMTSPICMSDSPAAVLCPVQVARLAPPLPIGSWRRGSVSAQVAEARRAARV